MSESKTPDLSPRKDDLVKRLRECAHPMVSDFYADEMIEAADEIERLKQERKNFPPASESEYVRRLEADNARLRAELNWISTKGDLWSRQVALAALARKGE